MCSHTSGCCSLQCAEDAEELFCQGDGAECHADEERGCPKPMEDEDEEEGIEEEEEEGFGSYALIFLFQVDYSVQMKVVLSSAEH